MPDVVQVTVGGKVTWMSAGKRPHDVVADDESFRSSYLYPGDSWSWTFTNVGEFAYYCSLHGDRGGVGHAGKVIVTAKGAPATAAPRGAPRGARGPAAEGVPGASAPSAPVFVATNLVLDVRTVLEEPSAGRNEPPMPVAYTAGALIGLLLISAWRFATGGDP